MRQPIEARASAPGKLILAGEHATVFGYPALAAAAGLRVRARLRATPTGATDPLVRIELTDLGETHERRWSEIADVTDRARDDWQHQTDHPGSFRPLFRSAAALVEIALGEARARRPGVAVPELTVSVRSEVPLGAGFGSSAAVAATLTAATLAVLEPDRDRSPDLDELETLVTEVERRQHGRPSGVDGAVVLRGGILWVEHTDRSLQLTPLDRLGAARALGQLRLLHTGPSRETTGEVVARVRARYERSGRDVRQALERIGTATASLRTALERDDEGLVAAAIRDCQRGLETIGVVPDEVRRLVRVIEGMGGAAKISGAGSLAGPAAGLVLVYHPGALDRNAIGLPPNGRWIDAELGGPGLEIEMS